MLLTVSATQLVLPLSLETQQTGLVSLAQVIVILVLTKIPVLFVQQTFSSTLHLICVRMYVQQLSLEILPQELAKLVELIVILVPVIQFVQHVQVLTS